MQRAALVLVALLALLACVEEDTTAVASSTDPGRGQSCSSSSDCAGDAVCTSWSHLHAEGLHCYLPCDPSASPAANGCRVCVEDEQGGGWCRPEFGGAAGECVAAIDCSEGYACVQGHCAAP